MKNTNASLKARILFITGALPLLLAVTGCGEPQFDLGNSTAKVEAPGKYTIPAKVDILLVEDDTGSRFEAHDQIEAQLKEFLPALESMGWDYHLATTPLTTLRSPDPFNQIAASTYDGNWDALGGWTAPFPGADPHAPGMSVMASYFRTVKNYSEFLPIDHVSSAKNGWEPGLETIGAALTHPMTVTSGFLRDDALLVILMVGNGNDTSGAEAYIRPQDGLPWFRNHAPLESYVDMYSSVKPRDGMVQFHAVVSFQKTTNCLRSSARRGSRYIQMAEALPGKAYDICSQPVSSILGELSDELQATRLDFETRYLVIGHAPDLSTVRVVRYKNGNKDQTSEIPRDPVNGWTYAGYGTEYTVDQPVPMNRQTGYLIELHGTARLKGHDTAEVIYQPDTNPSE